MKSIGHLETELDAGAFGDFLYARDIDHQIDPSDDGRWEVWIKDDAQLDEARTLLDRYTENPDDPAIREAGQVARAKLAREQAQERAFRKHYHDRDRLFRFAALRAAPLTAVLIGVSVFVAIISRLGANTQLLQPLFITESWLQDGSVFWKPGLPEVRAGQIWRLITPIFIHFGILHILFNMLWLKDLGGAIERKQGSLLFGVMVLVIGITSNYGQYAASHPEAVGLGALLFRFFGGTPRFGGMSGVVYGLLGYLWIRGKFDPFGKIGLRRQTVVMMIIWFFLGLFGIIPGMANGVHAVGLGVGMAWGYVSARLASGNG
ncbi:MAG: rhomboid family intramembrane serine protease [Kiritimatiellae bacterium]|nr:rhomboid family intramembrane serine protease [Kiritimatiellia bacterium]